MRVSFSRPARVRFGEVWVDALTMEGAVRAIEGLVDRGRGGLVFTPNVDHVVMADQTPAFREVYGRADLSLCDGAPLLWSSRLLGLQLPGRETGSDLFIPVLALAAGRGRGRCAGCAGAGGAGGGYSIAAYRARARPRRSCDNRVRCRGATATSPLLPGRAQGRALCRPRAVPHRSSGVAEHRCFARLLHRPGAPRAGLDAAPRAGVAVSPPPGAKAARPALPRPGSQVLAHPFADVALTA